MTTKTVNEWVDTIVGMNAHGINMGLERIGRIAKKLQVTHFDCPVITVAGTNGKGSTIKCLESIYRAAGYKTGAYISPHLLQFNERISVDGVPIGDEELIATFEEIDKARGDDILSLFEFTTATGLLYLKRQDPDVLLLEIGLGGRLDAINIVEPDVSVVTSIALDHMDWLGDNRESIGFEKAGVYRPNKPAICGDPNPPASIGKHAAEIGADLYQINEEFEIVIHGESADFHSQSASYDNLPMPALMPNNVANALMAIECVQPLLPVSEQAINSGLTNVKIMGRFQRLSHPVTCILDVAHNPQSASWLHEQLQRLPSQGKTYAVVGMLKNKPTLDTTAQLLPLVDEWFVGGLDHLERGMSSPALLAQLKTQGVQSCYNFATIGDALEQAIKACKEPEHDRIVVFGSFHTVAAAHELLGKLQP